MSEVLHGAIRCVYLDIEWHGSRDDSVPRAVAHTATVALLRERSERVQRTLFLHACGDGKASYHVQLFVSKPFESPGAVGQFVRAHVAPLHPDVVDTAPYGSTQCWRCVGCVKRSAPNRPLLPLDGSVVTEQLVLSSRVRAEIGGAVEQTADADLCHNVPQVIVDFMKTQLDHKLIERKIHMLGNMWVFPSLMRKCPISRCTHRSNHVYGVVNAQEMTWELRCHAVRCEKQAAEPHLLPRHARRPLIPDRPNTNAPAWLRESGIDFWSTLDCRT